MARLEESVAKDEESDIMDLSEDDWKAILSHTRRMTESNDLISEQKQLVFWLDDSEVFYERNDKFTVFSKMLYDDKWLILLKEGWLWHMKIFIKA